MVEDIIAALSQHRWLFVVARNSSFAYKAVSYTHLSDALLFAAMARGAPQYLSAADAEALSRPWRDVFGDPAGPA